MTRLVPLLTVLVVGTTALGMFSGVDVTAQSARRPTRTVLSATPNPSLEGQAVTLTATVGAGGSSAAPVGGAEFYAGPTMLGAATLTDQGTARSATLDISSLPPGHHQITARYMGHPDFLPSVSPAVGHTVNAH